MCPRSVVYDIRARLLFSAFFFFAAAVAIARSRQDVRVMRGWLRFVAGCGRGSWRQREMEIQTGQTDAASLRACLLHLPRLFL